MLVHMADFSLWVTSKLNKGCVLLPLSNSVPDDDLEALYKEQAINVDKFANHIVVFEALRSSAIDKPTLYTNALINHIYYTASKLSRGNVKDNRRYNLTSLLPRAFLDEEEFKAAAEDERPHGSALVGKRRSETTVPSLEKTLSRDSELLFPATPRGGPTPGPPLETPRPPEASEPVPPTDEVPAPLTMMTSRLTQPATALALPPVPPFNNSTIKTTTIHASGDMTEIVSGNPPQPPPAEPAEDIPMTGGDDPPVVTGTGEEAE